VVVRWVGSPTTEKLLYSLASEKWNRISIFLELERARRKKKKANNFMNAVQ
jgi:hypothetical protein